MNFLTTIILISSVSFLGVNCGETIYSLLHQDIGIYTGLNAQSYF